jgi:hypothetical protein
MFMIGLTGFSIYYAIGNNIVCEPLTAPINYSIISTNCISNNTKVLVEIINCKDINSVGFTIEKDLNFTFKKTCWYKSNDVECDKLKSDNVYASNMTVVYDAPLEIQMWNNYISCLNFQRELFSMGNSFFAPMLVSGLFVLLIVAIYTKNPCKPVGATVTSNS